MPGDDGPVGGAPVAAPMIPSEGADALAAPVAVAMFDSRVVAARIRSLSTEIKRCYERELARDPHLRGAIRVEFTLTQDGWIVGTTVTENTVAPAVGECVIAVISSMHFSPGPIGGSVRYRFPFVFEPGG